MMLRCVLGDELEQDFQAPLGREVVVIPPLGPLGLGE
jgi:hypothetical protein